MDLELEMSGSRKSKKALAAAKYVEREEKK